MNIGISLSNGVGGLTFNNPSQSSGTVDFAINLNNSSQDSSCLLSHSSTVGSGYSWFKSLYGGSNGCGNTLYNKDPSARMTFGIYSTPESKKLIYTQEVY